MKVAVIDADTIVWTAAYLAQRDNLSPEAMLQELDTFITSILKNTKADKYIGFLQGPDNFRKKMFPDYKANRPESPDWMKILAPTVRLHLVKHWKFVYTSDGFEADDAVASIAEILCDAEYATNVTNKWDVIICAVDKDLKQIPGTHYNYKDGSRQTVTVEEAMYNASMQLLHGDTSDNIPNIRKGVGQANAKKILNPKNIDVPNSKEELVLQEFIKEYGWFNGLIKFAENVLKVILRRDNKYSFVLNDVPEYIKQSQSLNIQ